MTLAELTYYAFLLRNDLHHIHLHAAGPQFDKVHAITDELYDEAQDEVDSLAEMAIAEGCEVKSFTDVRSVIDDSQWPTIEGEVFDMPDFVEAFDEIGHRYLDAIEDCDCNDIHRAALDEIALFWDKEVNFFNAARQIGCEECEAEIDDELDDTDAMEAASIEDDDDEEFGLQSMTSDMIVAGFNPLDDKDDESDDSGADLWTDSKDKELKDIDFEMDDEGDEDTENEDDEE